MSGIETNFVNNEYSRVINSLFCQKDYDIEDFLVRYNLYNNIYKCFDSANTSKKNVPPSLSNASTSATNTNMMKLINKSKTEQSEKIKFISKEVEILFTLFNGVEA